MIEIEKRYKVYDPPAMQAHLATLGIEQTGTSHIIDEWFAPLNVQSHKQQEQWFDIGRGIAYRVRRIEQLSGLWAVKVETKQLTGAGNHNTFKEGYIEVTDYDDAHALLARQGYWNWLTIDKTRIQFNSPDPDIDIVLDEIGGLAEKIGIGAVLEIEYKGNASRDEALKKLVQCAVKLGVSEDQLFAKSLTVEAMTVLAQFRPEA
jgi:adenylate cyclase class IV